MRRSAMKLLNAEIVPAIRPEQFNKGLAVLLFLFGFYLLSSLFSVASPSESGLELFLWVMNALLALFCCCYSIYRYRSATRRESK